MGTNDAVQESSKRRFPSWLSMFVVFSNLCLFSSVAWVYAGFGSVRAALDYFHGRYLYVRIKEASFSNVAPGDQIRGSYLIENRGRKPIRILGCGMGCAGHPAADLPLVLEPGKASPFAVDVRVFVPQGQRSLKRCSGKDFQHEVFVPATTAAFHDEAVAARVLLQE